jgi:hypothetical protein
MVQSLGLFSSTALVVGSMIGSGIFIGRCRDCTDHRFAGAVSCGVGGDRHHDPDRRAELWRAGGDDAQGGRPVRLPA